MNYNFSNTLEDFLPHEISGKLFSDRLTEESDRALGAYAAVHAKDDKEITNALLNLRNSKLKPWQILMNRAFICEKLKLPFVVHCKSSVDRTNVAAAMITAMKQWLLSGRPIPNNNIHEIVDQWTPGESPYNPFKELFAYAFTKGLKIPELARYEKGYKLHLNWMQNRALHDLLPERYLRKTTAAEHALTALSIPLILVASTVAILANLILWVGDMIFRYGTHGKTLGDRLEASIDILGTPFRILSALATFKLFTKFQLNEKYEEASGRSMLYDWNLER